MQSEKLSSLNRKKPFRVVLAEDDQEMRLLLAGILRKTGYTVVECHDGWELLSLIEPMLSYSQMENVDLIVSDIRMPGVTGMEILEGMNMVTGFPPMILITAFGDAKTHRASEQMGAAAIFDKPFDIDDLLDKVRELLPIA